MKSIKTQTSASRVANLTAAAVTLTLATLTACGSPVRHVRTAQPDAVATTSAGRGIPVGTPIPVVAVLDIASREGASERPTATEQEPYFAVLENVTNNEGAIVVEEGTQVMAQVTRRKNPRIGRPGWMEVSFKSTTRADGTVVRLDDAPQRFEGKSRVKGSPWPWLHTGWVFSVPGVM